MRSNLAQPNNHYYQLKLRELLSARLTFGIDIKSIIHSLYLLLDAGTSISTKWILLLANKYYTELFVKLVTPKRASHILSTS